MDLKEVAVKAYEESEEKERAVNARYVAKRENEIANLLRQYGITGVTITNNIVSTGTGRLKLQAVFRNGYISGWQILGICPECREEVWSAETYGEKAEDIGRLICEPFCTPYDHRCKTQSSIEHRLVDLIRELIREEMEEV